MTQHSVHAFPTVAVSALVALGLPRLSRRLGDRVCLEGYWDADRRRRVDWAHGAFLLVRRTAFDAVGGMGRVWSPHLRATVSASAGLLAGVSAPDADRRLREHYASYERRRAA